MAYQKLNILEDLKTAEALIEPGRSPRSVCNGGVLLCVSLAKLAETKAAQRSARRVRRVRRAGNIIMFPAPCKK